jgi:uncharacterized caspase-like protein
MRRAILIASSDFPDDPGIEPLRFPVNDVNAMESTLRRDDFGFEVQKFINYQSWVLRKKINESISEAAYEDLVLIYFSGHGKLSRRGELFLSCVDTTDALLRSTALPYRWLQDVLRDHSLQRVAVILDCCYAGRAIDGLRGASSKGAVAEQVRAAVTTATEGYGGHFFLGASGANQTAEERESDGHGRFTKHIIEGLSSGDADMDEDGHISAKDLSTYVKDRLRHESASQEPIEGGAYRGELILGSNPRRQLNATLRRIHDSLDQTKSHFTRETRRKIEDYLVQIEQGVDIRNVFDDPKYLILKRYSSNEANVEEVLKAFWTIQADPNLFAGAASRSLPLNAPALRSEGHSQLQTKPQEEAVRPSEKEEPKPDNQSEFEVTWAVMGRVGAILIVGVFLSFPLTPLAFIFACFVAWGVEWLIHEDKKKIHEQKKADRKAIHEENDAKGADS